MDLQKKMVIAGPCALESRHQLQDCIRLLTPLGVTMIRASLWKPRTQPGWEGLGCFGLPILLEETIPLGLTPATEIICAEHAQAIVDGMNAYGPEARILVWLGARNQNHLEQKKIAQILATGSKNIQFMFKNQMWEDERHWLGIWEHLISAGFPPERLLICHRGFSPGKMPNPEGLRNLPEYKMAVRIKEQTGARMILDPSHIGGNQENTLKIIAESSAYDFDGYMIEVHNRPEQARTDVKQQLSIKQFALALELVIQQGDRNNDHYCLSRS